MGIGHAENYQVLATTDSPYFLTPHIADLSSVVRVAKTGNKTYVKMLSREFIDELREQKNGKFRYHLWLNQHQTSGIFYYITYRNTSPQK